MNGQNQQNHQSLGYALNFSQKLKALTAPLFQTFDLTTFGYKRVFDDGRYLFVCTNQSWVEYHIKNIHSHGSFFGNAMNHALINDGFHRVLWPNKPTDHFLEALNYWNMWNGLNFYKKRDNSIELWTFSTSPEKHQDPNGYLSIIPYLERFILYFNAAAADLLGPVSELPLAVCQDHPAIFSLSPSAHDTHLLNKFLKETSINKIPIYDKKGISYLSKQETLCLSLVAQGKSAKEIAHLIQLSPRTIESYLASIKIKTGKSSKSALINIFHESCKNLGIKDHPILQAMESPA